MLGFNQVLYGGKSWVLVILNRETRDLRIQRWLNLRVGLEAGHSVSAMMLLTWRILDFKVEFE
jgi:hypothetical protein